MKRKICIVTGSRAEYGLLQGVMNEIASDPDLELQLIVTGMHLSSEFGLTYQQIEADGFHINEKVEMLLSSDSPVGVTKSIGLGVIGFAEALSRLRPDIMVVLGDRFEILAAAQAALIARIPIAHLHGGEVTEGAIDESIRHSITKMACWHFVAAEPYRKRVIQLGESPERVWNVGAPGLDLLQSLEYLDCSTLEEALGIALKSPTFLVTYHPATLGYQEPKLAMNELLTALDEFHQATIIFTYPNADTNGRILIKQLNNWVAANQHRSKAFVSLGQQRYLSLVKEADIVIGNSSSGLMEAPVLKRATVNIGERQKGRLKASSVIDTEENTQAIIKAINRALSLDFQKRLPHTESLYGSGGASRQIKEYLKNITLDTRKSFFDIEYSY